MRYATPLADHFAEKLHAYTRPRERRTRVKDLLDLTMILEELVDDLSSAEVMRRTIEATPPGARRVRHPRGPQVPYQAQ